MKILRILAMVMVPWLFSCATTISGKPSSGFYALQNEKGEIGVKLPDESVVIRTVGRTPGLTGPETGTSDLWHCKTLNTDCRHVETSAATSPGFWELFWAGFAGKAVQAAGFIGSGALYGLSFPSNEGDSVEVSQEWNRRPRVRGPHDYLSDEPRGPPRDIPGGDARINPTRPSPTWIEVR